MARHTSSYLSQYYYPSTASFTRYLRNYNGSSWGRWTKEENNYYNNINKQFAIGSVSSASTRTFEEIGLTSYQYGAYFVVMRIDGAPDGSWVGILRHNAAGYQITDVYKGEATNTPYFTSSGVLKTDSATAITVNALVFPISIWGDYIG